MSRKKLEDRNIRKLTKFAGGASYGITLPIEMVRKLGWKERQKLVVNKKGKNLIVSDWKIKTPQNK